MPIGIKSTHGAAGGLCAVGDRLRFGSSQMQAAGRLEAYAKSQGTKKWKSADKKVAGRKQRAMKKRK